MVHGSWQATHDTLLGVQLRGAASQPAREVGRGFGITRQEDQGSPRVPLPAAEVLQVEELLDRGQGLMGADELRSPRPGLAAGRHAARREAERLARVEVEALESGDLDPRRPAVDHDLDPPSGVCVELDVGRAELDPSQPGLEHKALDPQREGLAPQELHVDGCGAGDGRDADFGSAPQDQALASVAARSRPALGVAIDDQLQGPGLDADPIPDPKDRVLAQGIPVCARELEETLATHASHTASLGPLAQAVLGVLSLERSGEDQESEQETELGTTHHGQL